MEKRNRFSSLEIGSVVALFALTAAAIMISAAGRSSLMGFALLAALALIPLYILVPMGIAGNQQGWQEMEEPRQEDKDVKE